MSEMADVIIFDEKVIFDGEFDACRHRICFFYEIGDFDLQEHHRIELEEEAERRAREMISQDYMAGELCASLVNDQDDAVYLYGWWRITRE